MWLIYFLLCAILGTNIATNFDIEIISPPEPDVKGKTELVPTADGGFIEVNVDEAMASGNSLPYFDLQTDVYFELYTRTNPDKPYLINMSDIDSLRNSPFNRNHPTRIAVHGWRAVGEMFELLIDAYFNQTEKEFNFIAVNWVEGASTFNYVSARLRVDAMGPYVSDFIEFLIDNGNLNLNDCVLIGHSLGAHIVGIAGKKLTNYNLTKIVGLDPASPLFSLENEDRRLAKGDADYVEIIHSNAGILGLSYPMGHASFYPNGGKTQPGCGWDVIYKCAHQRSYLYYAESIHNAKRFYAWKCESYDEIINGNCHVQDVNNVVIMGGEYGEKEASGIYYLQTNDESLFAQGMPKVN